MTQYSVRRTSQWKGDVKPCDEAYAVTYTANMAHWSKPEERTKWFVDLEGFEALKEFILKYEPIVISEDVPFSACGEPRSTGGLDLEIYDDYRE